jgi:putative sigma-54 modulation protein
MELHVKGKNLEVSDAIRSYAERKLGKLDKHVNRAARVEVELTTEKNPSIAENQVAEATVWLKGHTLRAREATRDMKASIDELSAKLLRQVKDEQKRKAARRKIDKHALDALDADAAATEL